jgi:TetR/AcrR family transcriptional regulator, regulator of cefoperazone and chloramphenicol sensitivity
MRNAKKDNQVTRIQLLQAAGECFAQKGYHGATTRDICLKARANVAAINYHFHDKEGLYKAVFEHIIDSVFKDNPIPAFDSALPAEQRLELFIQSAFRRMLQPGRPDWMWYLVSWELAHPSLGIDLVVQKIARPLFSILLSIVRELLGDKATDKMAWQTTASIVGQFFFYRTCQPLIVRLNPDQRFDEEALTEMAAFITRFSLGAIDTVRSSTEGNHP